MKKQSTGTRLAASFNFVATGVAVLGMAWMLWAVNDEFNTRLENELGGTVEQSCVTARDRLPPHTQPSAAPVLNEKQQALTALISKMDETPIGRELNQSAARRGVLWCAGVSMENYGSYSMGIAILNTPRFGGAQGILTDQRTFNRALRTMYEENAHAWQDNTQRSLIPPIFSKPHHKITWHTAVEGTARVTTYSALNQHRLAGDEAVWNDNLSESKNRHIMTRMNDAADAKGDFGRAAHWAGLDAYYDFTPLVDVYQHSANSTPFTRFGRTDPANDSFMKMGTVPGVAGNYMTGNFDAYNPRYSYIRDPELRAQMVEYYTRHKLDPRPLLPPGTDITPRTNRVSPH